MSAQDKFDIDYAAAHAENARGDELQAAKQQRLQRADQIPRTFYAIGPDGALVELDHNTMPELGQE